MDKTCYYIIALALVTLMPSLVKTSTNLTTDKSALLSFKALITLDPHLILTRNWTNSTSVCSWIGVTCGLRHHRVTALNISNMNLSGTIPPQLGNLSFLVSLDLSYNHFSGILPREFSILPRLKFISLTVNDFTGEIPHDLGKLRNLQFFSTYSNRLSGAIPSSIFNISTLRTIDFSANELSGIIPINLCDNLPFVNWIGLSSNRLSGQIPQNISQCTQLQMLYLSNNTLSGQIPATIGRVTSLERLYLGTNNFNGAIPWEIGNLQNLVELSIERSNIGGTLPLSIFNMSSLQSLRLWRNHLGGSLSRNIANFTLLQELDIDENYFTGILPIEIGKLHQVERLLLNFNSFTGSIPPEFFNISTIKVLSLIDNSLSGGLPTNLCYGSPLIDELYLGGNNLTGVIPNSISNCPHLSILSLPFNQFNGVVPHSLGNLSFLKVLYLSSNNLRIESSTSELSFITSLTNCRSLKSMEIGDNPLGGIIPPSVGNLSFTLEYLYAYNCKIKGSIPAGIGNLSNLITLSLSENDLSGNVPISLKHLYWLQGLELGNNNLKGSIPKGLCDLQFISAIYLSQNQFSGLIPKCFGNFSSLRKLLLDSNKLTSSIPSNFWRLTDLLELDLSSNSLDGFLPPDIGNLVAATRINLAMNQFSETIPTTIGNLQNLNYLSLALNRLEGYIPVSVGNMISLLTLDLTYNNLSGPIPKSLETLKYLEYFNVSFNALSGEIPIDGPFKNFTMESFKANKALCGIPRFQVPLCRIVPNHKSRTKRVKLALFILAGMIVIITIVSFAFIFLSYKRNNKETSRFGEHVPSTMPERISYYEILRSTDQFNESNLLGIGSYGSVYKGILEDGKVYAFKVFNQHPKAAFDSFDVECEVLRNLRHRNLTKVLSSCSNEDFKALVLEYMPNANLEKWLYSHNYFLGLGQRLDIMIDVASALEYLHHGYSTLIVHCDLKPSNVLLDEEMIAHVSDFGISKMLGDEESTVLTNTLATLGYIAPEYGLQGLVSTRCDVYSFGVMLMETFTRTRPSDDMFSGDMTLKSWVASLLPHSPDRVVDPNLFMNLEDEHGDKILQCVSSILFLALKCSTESPGERINIKEALAGLQKVKSQFISNT